MTTSSSLAGSDPILSLVLAYRFSPTDPDSAKYLSLPPSEKQEIDFLLMQELLQTLTFDIREEWIELDTGDDFDYMSHEQIRAIINSQLATLAIAGRPGARAKVPKASSSKAKSEAMYLIIPPHEHRSTNYEGLTIDGEEWRLDQKLNGDSYKPRVIAALSVGFPIPTDAMSPRDRMDVRVDAFLGEVAEFLDEMAGKTDTSLPDDFANPMETPDPHDLGGVQQQLARMQSRLRRMGRLM